MSKPPNHNLTMVTIQQLKNKYIHQLKPVAVLCLAVLCYTGPRSTLPLHGKKGMLVSMGFIQAGRTGWNSGGRLSPYSFTLGKQDKGSPPPFQFCANFASHTNWLAFRFWCSCWFSLFNPQQARVPATRIYL